MSFSTDVKEELSKISNLANKDYVRAELFGYINTINVQVDAKSNLKFRTESEYNINRFSKLLNNVDIINYSIDINGKNFNISIPRSENSKLEKIYSNYEVTNEENIEKSFVRGTFLGSGSINNPKNKYHIEIILKTITIAENIVQILEKYGISFKIMQNKTKYSIYSKDGEEISKFLAFIGANKAVMNFEEIRVYRDMRNNVNRLVNCETANLNKTVNAAVKQIDAINKLKKEGKFNSLPDNLKEIAKLRIENPEASLAELGMMLQEPIGKSGVNYRLNTIIKMAK